VRKTQALLKSSPTKLLAPDKAHMAWLSRQTPAEGCEDAWEHYVKAVQEEGETYARYDAVYRQVEKEGGTSACKSYEAFLHAEHVWATKAQAALGFLDSYERAKKMVGVPVVAAEDDLRAIVGASLGDNMDGIQINLKSIGLLGARVAQAIRHDVIEEESTDIPLCQDHNHNNR